MASAISSIIKNGSLSYTTTSWNYVDVLNSKRTSSSYTEWSANLYIDPDSTTGGTGYTEVKVGSSDTEITFNGFTLKPGVKFNIKFDNFVDDTSFINNHSSYEFKGIILYLISGGSMLDEYTDDKNCWLLLKKSGVQLQIVLPNYEYSYELCAMPVYVKIAGENNELALQWASPIVVNRNPNSSDNGHRFLSEDGYSMGDCCENQMNILDLVSTPPLETGIYANNTDGTVINIETGEYIKVTKVPANAYLDTQNFGVSITYGDDTEPIMGALSKDIPVILPNDRWLVEYTNYKAIEFTVDLNIDTDIHLYKDIIKLGNTPSYKFLGVCVFYLHGTFQSNILYKQNNRCYFISVNNFEDSKATFKIYYNYSGDNGDGINYDESSSFGNLYLAPVFEAQREVYLTNPIIVNEFPDFLNIGKNGDNDFNITKGTTYNEFTDFGYTVGSIDVDLFRGNYVDTTTDQFNSTILGDAGFVELFNTWNGYDGDNWKQNMLSSSNAVGYECNLEFNKIEYEEITVTFPQRYTELHPTYVNTAELDNDSLYLTISGSCSGLEGLGRASNEQTIQDRQIIHNGYEMIGFVVYFKNGSNDLDNIENWPISNNIINEYSSYFVPLLWSYDNNADFSARIKIDFSGSDFESIDENQLYNNLFENYLTISPVYLPIKTLYMSVPKVNGSFDSSFEYTLNDTLQYTGSDIILKTFTDSSESFTITSIDLTSGYLNGFGLYNGEQLVKEYTTLPQEISYSDFGSYSSLYLRPIINTIKGARVILSDGIGDDGRDLGSVVYSVMVDGSPYSKGSSFEISEDSDSVTVTYNYTDTIYSNTAIYTFSQFEIYYDGHICYIENGGTLKYDVIKDYDVLYLRPVFTHTDKLSIKFSIINQTCRNIKFSYNNNISNVYVNSPDYYNDNTIKAWVNADNPSPGVIEVYYTGSFDGSLENLFSSIYMDIPNDDSIDIKTYIDFSKFSNNIIVLSPDTINLPNDNSFMDSMKINYYTGLRKTGINIFNLMCFDNSVVVRSYSDKDNTKIYSTFSDDKYYNDSFVSYIESLLTTPDGSSNIMSQEGRELILQGKLNFSVSAFEYSKNTSFSGITFSTTHVVDKLYHTSSESTTENVETSTRTIKLNKNDSTQLYYVDSMSDIEDVNDDIWGKTWDSEDLHDNCANANTAQSNIRNSFEGTTEYQGNGIFNFITTISSIEYTDDLFFDYEYYHCGTLVGYVNERSENTFINSTDNMFFGVTEPGAEATTIYGYDTIESERTLFGLRTEDVYEPDNYPQGSTGEEDIAPSIIDDTIASDIKKTLWDDSFSMPLDYCSLQTGNQFILFRLRNPYDGKVLNFDEDSAYGYTDSSNNTYGLITSSTSQDNGDSSGGTSTKYNMTHEQPYFLTLWEQRSIFNALNGKPTYVNETSRSENMSESYIETNFANNSSDDEDTAGIVNQYCEWYTNYINKRYNDADGKTNTNLYFTITEKNPRKAGRALVDNIDDWFNWYKREEEPGEITDGTPTDLPGGSPLMFVGPYLNQDYDMCIQSDATQSNLVLGPGESITVPIIVLYKNYEASGRDSCKFTVGFDLRNSLYNDPLYYQFTLNAKYSTSVNDSVSSQKASVQSSTRYNTTVR